MSTPFLSMPGIDGLDVAFAGVKACFTGIGLFDMSMPCMFVA